MRHSPFAASLALASVLFGGLLLGLGNMVELSLRAQSADAAPGHHQGHHGHEGHGVAVSTAASATTPADATPLILTLPAHCLFCLDGMAPQPTPLPSGLPPVRLRHLCLAQVAVPMGLARIPAAAYQERAPPLLV